MKEATELKALLEKFRIEQSEKIFGLDRRFQSLS